MSKKSSSGKNSQRDLTIGIITPSLSFDYAVLLYQGIKEAARERGVNLLLFSGNILLNDDNHNNRSNSIYSMAGKANSDGLIVCSALLETFSSKEKLISLVDSYKDIPLFSAGTHIEGIPSITIDNYQAMYDEVSHLIQVHGFRKIAFIKGPPASQDAAHRFRGYKDALLDSGIGYNKKYVLDGDFNPMSGKRNMDILFRENRPFIDSLDALVGANDFMILGALASLHDHDYPVEGNIALAGFDNSSESKCMTPPLTTCEQPIHRMGREALFNLLDLISGKKVKEHTVLNSRLIIRQSCGCPYSSFTEQQHFEKKRPLHSKKDWNNLNRQIYQSSQVEAAMSKWVPMVNSMREYYLRSLKETGKKQHQSFKNFQTMENIFRDRLDDVEQKDVLNIIASLLLDTQSLEDIKKILLTFLPRIDITEFFVSVYTEPAETYVFGSPLPERSRCIFAYSKLREGCSDYFDLEYDTAVLIPGEGLEGLGKGRKANDEKLTNNQPYIYNVKSLHCENKQIGFMILNTNRDDGNHFESLRTLLSSTLNNSLLIKRIQEQNSELMEVNTKLGAANEEIGQLNKQLSDENVSMALEMELARKIQTALLPLDFKRIHPDFDISAVMLPAKEMGGDYYDIVNDRDNNLWICIGDVSGHGVTPGLIMMMAQTAHTALSTTMSTSPKEMVNLINKILFDSINTRLKSKHYMTLTALKYHGEGRFSHAGAHIDLIIYRSKTDSCELIQTKGTFLFFVSDISRVTRNSEFQLNKGDYMFLFTDGLIEARNRDNELLDIEGFCRIVLKEARSGKSVEQMRDNIIDDVITWADNVLHDDMTLIVVRRI